MDEGEWTCAACTFRHAGIVAELRECTICGTARAVTRFRRADPAAVNAARQPESRRSLDPAVSPEPRRSPTSLLLALPDDVLQRVLVGVPRDDHDVAALVCKRTRGIITGPRFLAARRLYGFAEYCVVTVSNGDGVLQIKTAHKGDIMATIPTDRLSYYSTTTDGGARLFVCTKGRSPLPSAEGEGGIPGQILALDPSSRRWRRFATLPQVRDLHCLVWHAGLLYVAGGISSSTGIPTNSFHVYSEATGLWEELPPMLHACVWAASGVIGSELFIADGEGLTTLQIYDIATRTWRAGAPPQGWSNPGSGARKTKGVVVDGKLFLFSSRLQSPLVYDPQSNTWSEEAVPEIHGSSVLHACAHEGRVVVFLWNGKAFERAAGGALSRYTRSEANRCNIDGTRRVI